MVVASDFINFAATPENRLLKLLQFVVLPQREHVWFQGRIELCLVTVEAPSTNLEVVASESACKPGYSDAAFRHSEESLCHR